MKKEMHCSPGYHFHLKIIPQDLFLILCCDVSGVRALPSLFSFFLPDVWGMPKTKLQSTISSRPSSVSLKNIITLAWPGLSVVPWLREDETAQDEREEFFFHSCVVPVHRLFHFFCCFFASLLNGLSLLTVLFSQYSQLLILCEQPDCWPQVAPLNHRSPTTPEALTFTHFCFIYIFHGGSIVLQQQHPVFLRLFVSRCCRWTKVSLLPIIQRDGSDNVPWLLLLLRSDQIVLFAWLCVSLVSRHAHADRHTSETRNEGKGELHKYTQKQDFLAICGPARGVTPLVAQNLNIAIKKNW